MLIFIMNICKCYLLGGIFFVEVSVVIEKNIGYVD